MVSELKITRQRGREAAGVKGRQLMGLAKPDYRPKVYPVEEVVKAIVDLVIKERAGVVGNRLIYETVTGLQKYSRKRWDILKPILQIIGNKREYEVNGTKYILQTYSPMFASCFNFYRGNHKPESFIWGHPCGGFTVFKQ